MNNRQAGAYRELVEKEHRARERWHALHGIPVPSEASSGGLPGQRANAFDRSVVAEGTRTPHEYIPPTQQAWNAQTQQQDRRFQQTGPSYQPGLSFGSASGTYLPEKSGSLPLPQSSIYSQAIRVSSPRLYPEETNGQAGELHAVRQVEYPASRQVKVPVSTQALVPFSSKRAVKTKRWVSEPVTTLVTEEYTEIAHKPSVRHKEVWVKRLVPEHYLQPVAIRRTRQVPVTTQRRRAVDAVEYVDSVEHRSVPVPGYRVDEVVESRLLEVDEVHPAPGNPYAAREAEGRRVVGARDLGRIEGVTHARTMGREVFHPQDTRHADLEYDGSPHLGITAPQRREENRRQQQSQSAAAAGGFSTSFGSTARNGGIHSLSRSSSSSFSSSLAPAPATPTQLGLSLTPVAASGAEQRGGLRVNSVAPGSKAALAGVQRGDVILSANNRPTSSPQNGLQVLGQVLAQNTRALVLKVHRIAAARTLQITIMA